MLVKLILCCAVEVEQYAVVRLNWQNCREIFLQNDRLLTLVDILCIHLYDVAIRICRIVQLNGKSRVCYIAQQERKGRNITLLALGNLLNYKLYSIVAIVLLYERREWAVTTGAVSGISLLTINHSACTSYIANLGTRTVVAEHRSFTLLCRDDKS